MRAISASGKLISDDIKCYHAQHSFEISLPKSVFIKNVVISVLVCIVMLPNVVYKNYLRLTGDQTSAYILEAAL